VGNESLLDVFATARKDILRVTQEVQSVEDFLGSRSQTLQACQANLEDDLLQVVVVGEFNRGKSYLVNALLGEAVLPVGVRPTTAALTIVRHGPEPRAELRYASQLGLPPRQVSIEELKGLITALTPDAEEEAHRLESVTVFYPADLCKNGVLIIDTPGVNDLNQQREDITYKFIPQSDAAILVLDATMPLSLTEKEFLEQRILRNDIRKVFFVLNKADLVSEDELPEVVEYVRRRLSAIQGLGDNIKLYAVDSKSALKGGSDGASSGSGGLDLFRRELGNFLVAERGRLLLLSAASKVKMRLAELQAGIDSTTRLMKVEFQELEQREADLKGVMERATQRKQLLLDQIDLIREETVSHAQNTLPMVFDLALLDVEASISGSAGSPNEQLGAFVRKMQSGIVRQFEAHLLEYIETQRRRIVAIVQRDIEITSLQIKTFVSDIEMSQLTADGITNPSQISKAMSMVDMSAVAAGLLVFSVFPGLIGLAAGVGAGLALRAVSRDKLLAGEAKKSLVASLRREKPRVIRVLLDAVQKQLAEDRDLVERDALPAFESALRETKEAFSKARDLRCRTQEHQTEQLARMDKAAQRIQQCSQDILHITDRLDGSEVDVG